MGRVEKYSRSNTYIYQLQLRTMNGGVVTKLRLIVFLPSILVLWADKGTLAGSVPQMHDSSQFSNFLVLDKPGGKKSLIEIEGKIGRKESVQKQTGHQKIQSRDYSRKAKSQCKGVTFGECRIEQTKIHDISHVSKIEMCQRACSREPACLFYRFNHQTKECTQMYDNSYKSPFLCNISAGPAEKNTYACLTSPQPCDRQIEEECEYTGNDVIKIPSGGMRDGYECQDACQNSFPDCKYWIYNIAEGVCILKEEGTRICNVTGGPKRPSYEECRDFLEDHEK